MIAKKTKTKKFPQDGCQMVEVNLVPIIIPLYCNNKFALQYAHIHNFCFDSKLCS